MASQDPAAAAQDPPKRPVLANRLNRILAACWLIATIGSQQRRYPTLIKSHASDCSARRQAPKPLHRLCSTASSAQLPINLFQQTIQRLCNRTRISPRVATRSHNNIQPNRQDTSLLTKRFANTPLPKISLRRVANFLGNTQANTTVLAVSPNRMHHQRPIGFNSPLVKHSREFIATTQSKQFWKTFAP